MQVISDEQAQQLLNVARAAAKNAYAPYSHFPVGAAVLLPSGQVVIGANIENGSYGLTLCAERVAVSSAISQGAKNFTALAVWGEACPQGAITPCGACRQVMNEFCSPDTPIVMSDAETGSLKILSMDALLPFRFSLSHTGSSEPNAGAPLHSPEGRP